MRLSTLLVLLLFAAAPMRAQVQFDTVSTRTVGPGMIHWQIEAPTVPWVLDVLELDLTNPYLEFETVEANDARAGGNELTTDIAARKDVPGRRVVGAINADFFTGGGNTVSASVSNGQVVRRETPGRAAIGITEQMRAFISRPVVGGEVVAPGGRYALTGYNETRQEDALVLFNPFVNSTGTNSFGTEVVVRPVTPWTVNDTLLVVAETVEAGVGNRAVPAGKAVLSGHGAAATFLQGIQPGDTLRVFQKLTPGLPGLTQLVSGNPQLTVGGQPYPFGSSDFNTARHPRTVAGFNADTTRFYFITVDGRQSTSAGMSNFEMRDWLLRVGIDNAVNLDGGGSTTLVVRGEIVNSPSGAERPIANALVAYSTAPEGPLARIQMTPTFTKLFLGQSAQFNVRGADEYYRPIDLGGEQVTYSVAPELGTVTEEGVFTAGLEAGTGYVYATAGALRDSVKIVVKGVAALVLEPAFTVTDTRRPVQFHVHALDADRLAQAVDSAWVTWHSTDTTVGVVNAAGLFEGRKEGETQVVVRYAGGIADTSTVRVEVGRGETVLDPLDDLAGWLFLTENTDAGTNLTVADDTAATGGRSFQVHYRFTATAGEGGILTLQPDLPLFGVPDSVNVTLRSDGARHRVFLDFRDDVGQVFSVGVPRYADDTTRYALMPGPLTRANLSSESIVYPIRLTAIRLQLDYKGGRVIGKTYEGDLYLDDLRVTYPTGTNTAVDAVPTAPEAGFALLGNHPNPFRGRTTVSYRAARAEAVRLVLYDVLGRAVATVFDGSVTPGEHAIALDATDLPSGVYFLRAASRQGSALTLVVLR